MSWENWTLKFHSKHVNFSVANWGQFRIWVYKASLGVSESRKWRSDNWEETQESWVVLIKWVWEVQFCPELITKIKYNSSQKYSHPVKLSIRLLFNEAVCNEFSFPCNLSALIYIKGYINFKDWKLFLTSTMSFIHSLPESAVLRASISSVPITILGKL